MQKIIKEKIGDKVIILLQGDVDFTDSRLSRRLHSPQQEPRDFYIWIDCTTINCIKTHGICHFINQLLLIKALHVHMILLNMHRQQRQLLRLLQLEPLFTIVPDFEEAYQLVQAS